jgi:hypothetical protein
VDPRSDPEEIDVRAFRPSWKRPLFRVALAFSLLFLLCGSGWWWMIRMPGASHEGAFDATAGERRRAASLRSDVERLSVEIGERNDEHREALEAAAAFIEAELRAAGHAVARQEFEHEGARYDNLEAALEGSSLPSEIVVVGAHYDSAGGSPAANDNGSGVAAMLALARRMSGSPRARTIRFVAFANEEPPHFQQASMGSLVYARACRDRGDDVVAMISLETIGYYSDAESSQHYPFPLSLFYPSRGDFIGFIGDTSSRALVHRSIEAFRDHTRFPSEGAALPMSMPGVGWSDHWSFVEVGYPAVMVTDTALFRYPHYHSPRDLPEHLDFERMARVVGGIAAVVDELAREP